MPKTLTVHNKDGKAGYDIVLDSSFDNLAGEVKKLPVEGRRVCVVTDSTVAGLYLEEVKGILAGCCKEVDTFVFPAGEEKIGRASCRERV